MTPSFKQLVLATLTGLMLHAFGCTSRELQPSRQNAIHIGIVFNIGGKDDNSYNAAGWLGARRAAAEFNRIAIHDIEPGSPAFVEPAIRAFAESDCRLIIGIGSIHKEVIERVAMEYPQLHFVVVDNVVNLPNVASLVFSEEEGSYLVGIIAAKKSRSGTLGFIGGMDIPLIQKFRSGFDEGAHASNPTIKLLTNYIGITDSAWNDPARCREIALSQIDRGADVLFAAAGNSGLGAFDAIEGKPGTYVIGVDANQNWIKPGRVLTSMVKRVDNAVYQVIRDEVESKFVGGLHRFDVSNDGVAFALDRYNEKLIDASVIDEVESAKKRIIAGEIRVTNPMSR